MDLRAYFKKYLVHSRKFCKETGIPYQTFYNIYMGRTKIALETAMKIERFTQREVTCEDFEKFNEAIDTERKRLGKNFKGLYVDNK